MADYPSLLHEGEDPSPHMSGQFTPTLHTAPRGQKRSLTAAFPGGSGSGTLRTAVACRACRERKTRCSGHQPTCNYCSRAGVPCEYLPGVVSAPSGPQTTSDVSLEEWGGRILTAVEDLKQTITTGPIASHQRRVEGDASSDLSAILSTEVQTGRGEASQDYERHGHVPLPGPSPITSLSSILQWTPFKATREASIEQIARAAETPTRSPSAGLESASCNASELLVLAADFAAHQDLSLRILDVWTLRSLIVDIGEFGVSWTAESCLVLLVAAIGSLLSGPDTPRESHEPQSLTPQARRYWNMARKRLTWAAADGGLIGAQCHFLAGIWQLYDSDPRASWKSMAAALQMIDDCDAADTIAAAERELRQNIHTLALVLLCRLRDEMSLSFVPSSYHLDSRSMLEAMDSTQKQLSTAILCLLQIRQENVSRFRLLSLNMSLREICTMAESLKDFERQLESWYSRLPPQLRFSREQYRPEPDPNSGHTILRFLYLETSELSLRPSLYLTLHALYVFVTENSAGAMKAVVSGHIRKEVWEVHLRYRRILSRRLQQCFQSQTPFLEPGWLKRHTCATLGLLHIALDQARYRGDAADWDSPYEAACWQDFLTDMEAFLEKDRLCPQASALYLAMLRAQQSRRSRS